MRLVVASGNKGKLREIAEILKDYDVVSMQAAGFAGITLGKRILRAETAAIAFLSAAMFELGEWA